MIHSLERVGLPTGRESFFTLEGEAILALLLRVRRDRLPIVIKEGRRIASGLMNSVVEREV